MKKVRVYLQTRFTDKTRSAEGSLEDMDLTTITLNMPIGHFKPNDFIEGCIVFGKSKVAFQGQVKNYFPAEEGEISDTLDIRIEKIGNTNGLMNFIKEQQERATKFLNKARGIEY